MRLYFQFGLIVFSDSTDGAIKKKGNGGYFYYLANPEILHKGGRTLLEHMKFLADFENNIPETVDWEELRKKYIPTTSAIGFLSAGNSSAYGYQIMPGTTPRTILGEASLQEVQFAMLVGEVLTIKYGKIKTGVDINAPYSFEPYQLKEIEGRWYVIGNLYPLGHKEWAEIAVYDLARLQFADEENPDVLYKPFEGFDICCIMAIDPMFYRCMNKVIPVDLITHTEEFADYLAQHPFCSAQERLNEKTFRTYRCVTRDFIVQLGAYGEELTIGLPRKEGDEKDDRIRYHQLLNLLKKTGE